MINIQNHTFSIESLSEFTSMRKQDDLLKYLLIVRQDLFSSYFNLFDATKRKDRIDFRNYAHSTKGVADCIAFKPLSELMKYFQTNAASIDWTEVQSQVPLIFDSIMKFQNFIEGAILERKMYLLPDCSKHAFMIASSSGTVRTTLRAIVEKLGCRNVSTSAYDAESLAGFTSADTPNGCLILHVGTGDVEPLERIRLVRAAKLGSNRAMPVAMLCREPLMMIPIATSLGIGALIPDRFTTQDIFRNLLRLVDLSFCDEQYLAPVQDYTSLDIKAQADSIWAGADNRLHPAATGQLPLDPTKSAFDPLAVLLQNDVTCNPLTLPG